MSQDRWEEEFAEWIQAVRHPTLTPRARKRIWREAQRRARPAGRVPFPFLVLRLRPVAVALVCVFALFVGTFGTVLAAQNSMPTDFLYPVKRASEGVWWAVVPADDRPVVAVELAVRRMVEVEYLLDNGEPVPDDLWDDLAGWLAEVEQGEGGQVPEHVQARLEHHLRVLEQQMARHPDNPGLRRAIEASRHALEVLFGSPNGQPPVSTPSVSPGPPSTPPGHEGTPAWYRHRPTPPAGQGEEHGPPSTPPGQSGEHGPPTTPPGQSGEQGPPSAPPGQGGEHGPPTTPPGQSGEQGPPSTPPGQGGEHGPPTTPPGQSGEQGPPSAPPGQSGEQGPPSTPPGQSGEQGPPSTPPGQGKK
ncbi:MAG TPA: hypothetical protein ENK08_03380 [Chloroflexi bacterium]|nr:hypothetical protein [Chloroflexota bacterium]